MVPWYSPKSLLIFRTSTPSRESRRLKFADCEKLVLERMRRLIENPGKNRRGENNVSSVQEIATISGSAVLVDVGRVESSESSRCCKTGVERAIQFAPRLQEWKE